MQRKLLYSSALCALFGISGTVFGMEEIQESDLVKQYTCLTLTGNNNFFIFSPSGLIKQNKYDFEKNWNERGFEQFIQQTNRCFKYSFCKPTQTFDLSFSQLIITDTNDKNITLSVITANDHTTIKLGDFEKKQIEALKSLHTYEGKIELFRTGFYYPINKIIHYDRDNNPIETIHVESTNVPESNEEFFARINETLSTIGEDIPYESKARSTYWIGKILVIGGSSILILALLFPDRFTQFLQLFKRA